MSIVVVRLCDRREHGRRGRGGLVFGYLKTNMPKWGDFFQDIGIKNCSVGRRENQIKGNPAGIALATAIVF